ncbi:MAG: hypothetical protein EBS56_09460, partial [Planctomycetia bacterium]|nr:hypothetical protein [Planctomycetia bacterium]
EAEALLDESLKAREAAIADGLVPNEPVPSGVMNSKHLKGLLELRRGDLVHARHYLEIARKEYDAFQAAQQMAEESDDGDEPADEPATEPATKPETAEVDSVEEAITALDQTLTHVGLLTHLGELELAEGNAAKAAVLGKQAVDVGTAMLGAKHGVVLEPTILFVRANAALAERRLSENDPRGARTALQAALLGYSAVEPMVESFWVPTSARRTEAKEIVSGIRTKLAAAEAAVASDEEGRG